MAKGGIILADTHDLTVNPGDGEQTYAFLASLMITWGEGDVEKLFQFKHLMFELKCSFKIKSF